MARFLRRRLWVLLISAAMAAGCWILLPGTAVDRAALDGVARGFANPPFYFSGAGTHANPWALRTLSPYGPAGGAEVPVVVAIGDDPENVFQSSPPAPIDLAVILSNVRRLGATKVASAAVMAWEAPDAISLAALEAALDSFDAVATAVPLARGAVPAAIPPQFRNASVALDEVVGNAAALPVVNRLPISGAILGGERALAGFSALDSEEPGNRAPLIARWDDRVVFAFPVLAVLLRHELPVEGVEVRPGQYLKLGPEGPIVPIDTYGRLSVPLKPVPPLKVIAAEALIDGGDELFPDDAPDPVILRDDQSAADAQTREFSSHLAALISAVAAEAGLGEPKTFRRLPPAWEAGILAVVALLLAAFRGLPAFQRHIAFAGVAGVVLIAQWVAVGTASSWLPGLAALAATAAAFLVCLVSPAEKPVPAAVPEPAPEPAPPQPAEPEILPAPEPQLAPKKTVPKKTAKKAVPRRSARKKSPPKDRS